MFDSVIGLDIGSHTVKAAFVKKKLRGNVVLKLDNCPVNGDPSGAVRTIIVRNGWQNISIAQNVPGQKVVVRNISLPFTNLDPIRKVIKFEAEPLIPYPIDELIIDFCPTGMQQNGKSCIILMATPKNVIETIVDNTKNIGLKPAHLGSEAYSLSCGFKRQFKGQIVGNVALVELGHQKTTVVIVNSAFLLFTRCLAPFESVAELALNLQQTFDAFAEYHKGQEINHIYLCGGECNGTDLEAGLREKFDQPVSMLSEAISCHLVAIGSAVSYLERAQKHPEFLKDEFSGVSNAAIGDYWTLRLASVAIIVLIFSAIFKIYVYEREINRLTQQINAEFKSSFPMAKDAGNKIQQAQAFLKDQKQQAQQYEKIFGHKNSILEYLRELSIISPQNLQVRLEELVIDSSEVRLQATASSFQHVEMLKEQLLQSPLFSEIQITQTRVLDGPQEKGVAFLLIIKLNQDLESR